ncbi:uncharacterized protein LOC108149986 [Drosophila elegans]|uniref:uncharacterized protein LOC108149986 n=1 Tax=Drosophila elegans TaxID=30023 RepID=UPI0007E6E9DC|nr:uncharacterized protein LOC108149986 [Drosophila elegans]
MVYNQLRTLRTPLVFLVGFLFLFLLFRLTGPLQNPRYFDDKSPLPPPLHHKAAALHGSPPKLDAEKELENLPSRPEDDEQDVEALLRGNEDEGWAQSAQCAPYPRFEDLRFQNPYFQHTRHGNLSYYLYGAYYDRRPQIPEVMILGMVTTCTGPYPPTHLQMWFDGDTKPELAPLHETKLAWYEDWGKFEGAGYPTMLRFRVGSSRIPQLVSLVFGNSCAVPQNALKVFQPPAEEPPDPNRPLRTGVCVKYLRFADIDMSDRLVEWLELMRILGAGKITAYDIGELHPNISRTLAYYTRSSDGFLDLRKFQLPNEIKEHPRLRRNLIEVLLYNDCLYRSLYDFDFVAVVDVDEVIMPLGETRNWPDLLVDLQTRDVNCTARSGYCFQNVYFPKELPVDARIPEHFHMLRHLVRVADHLDPASAVKCLHNTAYVRVLHNHFALEWRDACGPFGVSTDLGQLQHYRHVDDAKTLKEPPPKRDDNIKRFQQQLIHNSMAVHRQLGWAAGAY